MKTALLVSMLLATGATEAELPSDGGFEELMAKGSELARRGDLARARSAFASALAAARRAGRPRDVAMSAESSATIGLESGQVEGARELLAEALAAYEAAGDVFGVAAVHAKLAELSERQGNTAAAEEHRAKIAALDRGEIPWKTALAAKAVGPPDVPLGAETSGWEPDSNDAWYGGILGFAAAMGVVIAVGVAIAGSDPRNVRIGVDFPPTEVP